MHHATTNSCQEDVVGLILKPDVITIRTFTRVKLLAASRLKVLISVLEMRRCTQQGTAQSSSPIRASTDSTKRRQLEVKAAHFQVAGEPDADRRVEEWSAHESLYPESIRVCVGANSLKIAPIPYLHYRHI